jgi:hypothetical protein
VLLADDEGTRRANVDNAKRRQLFGEQAGLEAPVPTHIHAAHEHD